MEKSLWASQRSSKEALAREKMSVVQWEAEETKMKSKIKSLETQVAQLKENEEEMKNRHEE